MLTHFWDADGDDLHIASFRTDGDVAAGDILDLGGEPYFVERINRKVTGKNESLHIFVREVK